jgi:hypothetical protein
MSHKITAETTKMVENAAGMGLRHEHIATLLGITDKTLRLRYRNALDVGKAKACMKVATSIFQNATTKMNPTSQIWWSKTQMGWREPPTEISGPGGGPVIIRTTATDEAL